MAWRWLERLRTPRPSHATPATITRIDEVAPPSRRSSQIFDSHVLSEAAASKNPQAVSLAYDEGRAYGLNVAPQSWMGMTPRERKETLLSIFLTNPWASNCIDTIARYIVSGGISIEPRVENPDQRQYNKIQQFLLEINEDWDFLQYVCGSLIDEQIFGESFTEFLMRDRLPWQVYKIDCLTMDTETDAFGRVTAYKQQLTSTSVINTLDPKTIIRWWNPHPRAQVDPFSQLERVQDAILLDKKMVNWLTTFFQKGGKYNYYFKGLGDQDEAVRFLAYFRENYTGEKNAQTPPVLWGNAEIMPLGNAGPLDMDFDKGLDRMQSIVLSAFHVPPSIACIAESGNRLTDMSDGQRKILQYIACDPLRHRFFEKFNYRLIKPFFGTDYYVTTRYADFRDDEALAKVADMRIRNGSLLIDEVRQEMGKEAYKDGGGAVAVIVTTREITPVPRLKEMEGEQRMTAKATIDTATANADLAATKAKQAKEPPAPVPAALQVGDERTPYKLGGGLPPAKESQHDGPYPPRTPGAQEAIRTDAEEAADAGRDQGPSTLRDAPSVPATDHETDRILHTRGPARTGESVDGSHAFGDASATIGDSRRTEHLHHTSETIEEPHAQPETHPQSDATDAVPEGAHEDTGNRALYQAQEAVRGDGDRDIGSSGDSGTSGDPAAVTNLDQQKAELTIWLTAFFLSFKQRGSLALPTAAAVLTVYTGRDEDRTSLAQKLAEANLAAQIYAYTRDRAAVGLPKRSNATDSTLADLLSWSHAQVDSIAQTLHDQLAGFVRVLPPDLPPETVVSEVDPWIDRYIGWKAPQIANATIGTGANTGSMDAIDDMIDADSDPSIDFSTDNVRIRVVPSESSSDYCANYAGQEYSVSEYLALGIVWPAHPGCPHGIEAYLDDSNDLAGGEDV